VRAGRQEMKTLERRLRRLEADRLLDPVQRPIEDMDEEELLAVMPWIDTMTERQVLELLGGEPDPAELAAVIGPLKNMEHEDGR